MALFGPELCRAASAAVRLGIDGWTWLARNLDTEEGKNIRPFRIGNSDSKGNFN